MFGTVIWDVYRQEETEELSEAINDLASPTDSSGWSSSAVYAFYDPEPNDSSPGEALRYLGLATDLPTRFAQHNGIQRVRDNSSKRRQIEAWFKDHQRLGFSAFVQSALAQAHTARFKKSSDTVVDWKQEFDSDIDARGAIARVEGQLIESAVLDRKSLPTWNKIGGSKEGQARASGETGRALINLMEGVSDNLFVSRRSIRELSNDPSWSHDESEVLHDARVRALASARNFASDKDILAELDTYEQQGHAQADSIIIERAARIKNDYLFTTTRHIDPA